MYSGNSMMGEGKRLREGEWYCYSNQFLPYFFVCGNIAIGLTVIGAGIYFYDRNGWPGVFLGGFYAWFSFLALKYLFERRQAVVINDMGICGVFFGRVWRSNRWVDVIRIEKIRKVVVTNFGSRYGYELAIVGKKNKILITDEIHELPKLLVAMNRCVKLHQIPLVLIDKGEDTQAEIKRTVKDKQERKKLLKEGVRTSISTL